MDIQGNQNSQHNLENKNTSHFQNLLQSYVIKTV